MKHYAGLCGGLLLIFAAAAHADDVPAAPAEQQRPNFIFFITDDISTSDLGCYGNDVIQTPHLDRMAAEGLVFDNAYLTISSCSPSRCSIITGRYPHNTGAAELHTNLPEDQPRFPGALQEAGYYTVRSGKHHGEQSDEVFDFVERGDGPGKQENWVDLLRDRPKDRPFFCWFASSDAHRGWQFTDEAPRYDPAEIEVPPFLFDGPLTRSDLADYYHEVSRTDYYAGQLLAELERQGVADNTYFIYCADNGRPFPRCKTYLYDSGIKTPLIIWCPGRIEPGRTSSLVSAIDFAPTILELAGADQDPRIQGVSFAAILQDPQAVTRDYAFAEHNWHVYQNHERLVRFGKYTYIRNAWPERHNLCVESDPTFPAGEELWQAWEAGLLGPRQTQALRVPQPAEQLFDVEADPHQLNNLVGSPEHAAALSELRGLLDQWAEETGDTVPENPTNDRYDSPYHERGRAAASPDHRRGEMPGAARNATQINAPGPVRAPGRRR